jgi:salicylate hydroxylase
MITTTNPKIHVAIIGGGITGVILALGLEKRNVSYTLHERALALTEIGAGIGFSPNAERALRVVDPRVDKAYKKVLASSNGDSGSEGEGEGKGAEEYFRWVDGYGTNEVVAELFIGIDAFQGGRRSEFLEAWSGLIPREKLRFGREIESVAQREEDGRVTLKFRDGSLDEADIGWYLLPVSSYSAS